MKRFISFILLILLCFIFLGFGLSFAGIVPVVGQKIEQVAAIPDFADNEIMNYCISDTKSSMTGDYIALWQCSEMIDNQTIIKNIKENIASRADGIIAAELGTVLKCPIYRHL